MPNRKIEEPPPLYDEFEFTITDITCSFTREYTHQAAKVQVVEKVKGGEVENISPD